MSALKVGDIVIGQNHVVDTNMNGMEGQIIGGLEWRNYFYADTGEEGSAYLYDVLWTDGDRTFQPTHTLRRKTPPASTADMREYEDLIARLMNRKERVV